MTELGMMNIYRTKIKLRCAADQSIYLVIFYWVVGNLYLSLLILLLDLWRGFSEAGSDQSRYMLANLYF